MAERFDRFTERARRVLMYAQQESAQRNHGYVGTEHLLLGLVREEGGVAAAVFQRRGIAPAKITSAVEFIMPRALPIPEIGLTPRAKKVIELAIDEAHRLDMTYIGTEHLLLGLVREGEGIAAGVLESLGLTLEVTREAVTLLLRMQSVERGRAGAHPPLFRVDLGRLIGLETREPRARGGETRLVILLAVPLSDVNFEVLRGLVGEDVSAIIGPWPREQWGSTE